MDQHDSFFTPEHVDAQIDHALGAKRAMSEDQFLAEMQQAARQIRAEQERSLRRVEDRLIQHALSHTEKRTVASSDGPRRLSSPRIVQQGSIYSMEKQKEQKKSRLSSIGRRISVLVAVLVMAALVGSLVFVMSAARQNTARHSHTTNVGAAQTATATRTPASTPGTTVYTTPGNQGEFIELAWSSDSTRIASFTAGVASSTAESVQIWDATTGKHTVQVPITDEVSDLAWSPTLRSQLLAIGTYAGVLIVNGQTGTIVHSYPISTLAETLPTVGGGTLLSARMPASGGLSARGLAWSPDGNSLAVAVSDGVTTRKIQVLNPQTGVVDYTLPVAGNYIPGEISWSTDDKYLAASVLNINEQAMIWVWNTATKQVVFQHASSVDNDSIAWQPDSTDLAFIATDGHGGGPMTSTPATLAVWNVATGKPAMQPHAMAVSSFAWSPDGTQLAYASQTATSNPVSIIDASTGKLVYTYTQMNGQVATLAWSPNGKYIVSGDGYGASGTYVARVWAAE